MSSLKIRVENHPPDTENPFGLRVYHLSESISEHDGYWFYGETEKERMIQEIQREQGFTPPIFSYQDAMDKSERAISAIGKTGCDVLSWFAGTLNINFRPTNWPAVEIVSARQINVRLSQGIEGRQIDWALGSALEIALGMPAEMVP